MRIGILGLGMMGRCHLSIHARNKESEIIAICDTNEDLLKGDLKVIGNIPFEITSVDFSRIKRYSDTQKFMADPDIELVDICLPTFLHSNFAIDALDTGKHVICEKPIALHVEEADNMLASAKKSGKFLMIAHCLRFWPEYVFLKKTIESGEMGRVLSAGFIRLGSPPGYGADNWLLDPKRSGGAIIDLHIHDADMIRWLFGEPSEVVSQGAASPRGACDYVITEYLYKNGPAVWAEGGWLMPPSWPFTMSFRVLFEKGLVEYDSTREKTLMVRKGNVEYPEMPKVDAYEAEIDYFIKAAARGKKPELGDPEDAWKSLNLVLTELKSVKSGRPEKP